MPESWDAGVYRNRATAWLQKAESLPEGHEREACLALAEGYVRLASLSKLKTRRPPSSCPRADGGSGAGEGCPHRRLR